MARVASMLLPLLFVALNATAQDYRPHWIYAPQGDSLAHVWFRRAYTCNGRPRQATLTVTTTGRFKVYVNECNIGTALSYPLRYGNDSTAVAISFDITTYLRPDTNVVAIVYSPTEPHATQRQVAVNIHGTTRQGKSFSIISDDNWLCRRANSQMKADGGEIVDGRGHNPTWKAAPLTDAGLWTGAAVFQGKDPEPPLSTGFSYDAIKISKVKNLASLHISQAPVLIYLSDSYWGFPRITLREARRGELLQIGNLTYICNGTMDEQAFPVFDVGSNSAVSISGDKRFRASQITGIEQIYTCGISVCSLTEK